MNTKRKIIVAKFEPNPAVKLAKELNSAQSMHSAVQITRTLAARQIRRVRKKMQKQIAQRGQHKIEREKIAFSLELNKKYRQKITALEKELSVLAISVAKSIIGEAIEKMPELSTNLIRNAIKDMLYYSPATLYVAKEDAQNLRQALPSAQVEVIGKTDFVRGTAELNSAVGSVVINWQEQLEYLKCKLEEQFA